MPITINGPASAIRQHREHAPCVLIVDDMTTHREHLSQILRTNGYEVLEATDGRDALRILATTLHVEAILLDLLMPSMNGWEFRELQLRDARLAAIPTLVITVRRLVEHERYLLRIGSDDTIQKPFDDRSVLQKVAHVLTEVPSTMTSSPDQRWISRDGRPLLWSRHGSVACAAHAPAPGSDAWNAEGWTWIPRFAGKNKIEYCCQHCEGVRIRHHGPRSAVVAGIS